MKLSAALVLGCALLTACDTSVACVENVNPAIVVSVTDAGTGQPLDGATGFMQVTPPAVGDAIVLQPGGDGVLIGWGGLGVYGVQVDRAGYASWHLPNVIVRTEGSPCGAIVTVHLMAALSPLPQDVR